MTTLREKYNQYRTPELEAKFAKWNNEQEEPAKIRVRMPFTIEWPEAKLLKREEKPKTDKDGKDFTDKWRPYKMLSATGQEVPYKVQSPSVIAKRGLCIIDTGSGKILSIPCTYDMRNPEHEQFMNQYEARIALPAYYEVMRNPGDYGIDNIEPVSDFSQDVVMSQEFQVAMAGVKAKFSKFARFPKKAAKVYDTKSPLRTIFYTPINYSPKNENETGSKMRCLVSFGSDVREYSMEEIKKFCEGIVVVNGKETKGTPKGFECSPELQFIKLHIGSQLSNKTACPAVFITRFQEAPRSDSQEEKIKYVMESGIEEDSYSASSDTMNILESLKQAQTQNKLPTGGSGFNVMGGSMSDNNITGSTIVESNGGSFLSMADKTNSSTKQENTSSKIPDANSPSTQQVPVQVQSNLGQDSLPYTREQGNAYVQMANTLPPPLSQQGIPFGSMNGLPNGIPSIPGLSMGMPQGISGIPSLGQVTSTGTI